MGENTQNSRIGSNRPLIALSRYLYQNHHRRVAFHGRYVLGRLLNGDLLFRYDGVEEKMRTDRLYLFQPESLLVDIDSWGNCEVDYYHLDHQTLQWALEGFGLDERVFEKCYSLEISPAVQHALEDLSHALNINQQHTDLQDEMFINLVDLLLDAKDDGLFRQLPKAALDPVVARALDQLKKLSVPSNTIEKPSLFTAQLSATPAEVEGAVRAERVRELLERGATLEEAATALGLAHESALADLFKRSWVVHPDLYQGIALGLAVRLEATPSRS